jgi:hypothetical protein
LSDFKGLSGRGISILYRLVTISSIIDFPLMLHNVKLPAHKAGLPSKVISFYIVPLDPAYLPAGGQARRGLLGTFRSKFRYYPPIRHFLEPRATIWSQISFERYGERVRIFSTTSSTEPA